MQKPFIPCSTVGSISLYNQLMEEPMSRSMQLHYIHVTAFSKTDLFLDRISMEWDSRGSTMTNHKTLIDETVSLERNCLSFTRETVH